MDRAVDIELPKPEIADDVDQIVVLRHVPWTQYDALLRARGQYRHPRMAYLDGALEVMTTSSTHELIQILLSRLIEAFADVRELSLNGIGRTTFRKKGLHAGLEPDSCYCVGKMRRVPGLAIEVVHRSGGIKKLEIYRRLGVAEVWFWIAGRICVYRMVDEDFVPQKQSTELRGINLAQLEKIISTADFSRQTEIVRSYRQSLTSSRRR